MRNKQRVAQIENKVKTHSDCHQVFIFPKGIYEEKEIAKKIIDETNKHFADGKAVAMLPDNLRASPDKLLNETMRKVIIREGREDLLKFIRTE